MSLFGVFLASIWTEYREIFLISPYSVRMQENRNQKNSKYRLFSHSDTVKPLNSGHHLDLEKVSAIETCPLPRLLSQIGLFCKENLP